jgi:hypothetical protein
MRAVALAGGGGIKWALSATLNMPAESASDEVRQSPQSKEDDKEHKADGADYVKDSFVFQYATGPCRAQPDTYRIQTVHEHLSALCRSKTFARLTARDYAALQKREWPLGTFTPSGLVASRPGSIRPTAGR